MTPDTYRRRAGLPHDYPLVCRELSREIAERAPANDLVRQGARARNPWNNAKALSRRRRINGAILPSVFLVSKAEACRAAGQIERMLSGGEAWGWATNLAAQLSRPSWRDGLCRTSPVAVTGSSAANSSATRFGLEGSRPGNADLVTTRGSDRSLKLARCVPSSGR
jgi:hypothetical protein